MARCLVLGANGFLGSHLVDALIERGHTVRAFDRFSRDLKFNDSPNIEVITGDFMNRHDVRESLKDIEYVFHFISTTTPATAEEDPLIDIDTNIRLSVELFDECSRSGIKRLIFASTGGAIYGPGHEEAKRLSEVMKPNPVSPYAIGKLSIEHYLRYYRVKHGLESVSFRISNPYGDRQPLHSKQGVIPIFLEKALRDNPLTVLGDGTMVRDYVFVKDMADMISSVFDRQMAYDTYNLGSGVGVNVNQLVDHIKNLAHKDVVIDYAPMPPTFVQSAVLDTQRFESEFRLSPKTTLREGLRLTRDYIEQQIRMESMS